MADAAAEPAGEGGSGSDGARRVPLGEIARVFLALGLTSFGGPAAHVAMMERELVARRKWLPRERFVDLLSAANLIPGPNSTELAIHVGHECGGGAGLVVAGACFILPAACIVLAIAAAYVRFGSLPASRGMLYGVAPVMIAIVAQALVRLSRSVLKGRAAVAVAVACAALSLFGVHELALLFGGAAVFAALRAFEAGRRPKGAAAVPVLLVPGAVVAGAAPVTVGGVFGSFLTIGSVLYGSGYVLLAFLRSEFVVRLHWLTERQLLDAVAVGQVTPGPVFTTATFVGYVLARVPGALAATAGIFLPSFVFVALTAPFVARMRASRLTAPLLDGVNASSLGLMAAVSLQLGRASLVDPLTVLIAAASGVTLWRTKLNATWLIAAGALAGVAASRWITTGS